MKLFLLRKFSVFFVVCSLASCSVSAQKTVNFESELNRLYTVGSLPEYMEGTVVKQISSYDRTGGNDDGFGGTYSFIREEPTGGLVIFDEEGQSVIERIWTPTPTDDTLDFYLDGSTEPTMSIRFRDLFNNSQAPFLAPIADQKVGGFYSYIPIPYKESCKIVFRGEKILFHQIQFRSYDKQYQVESYQPEQVAQHQQLLDKIVQLWSKDGRSITDFTETNTKSDENDIKLQPGTSETILELDEGGRLLGIELAPMEAFSGLYKQIDLKITWDDEDRAAVYVPVADFFGFAFGSPSMESLLIGADAGKAYSYIPMPFDKSAKVELVYRDGHNADAIDIQATVYYDNEKRDAEHEGRFYAYWKNEEPALGSPYVFLEGGGKGHYVGTVMIGHATDYTHFTEFFEGDDYTEIDGEMTVHGTGSEDYFNGGWYAQPGGWVERLGAPLTGCLEYNLPMGRTGGYRLFISDKMPFSNHILHNIEHGPTDNNRLVNYTSVAMYYADKPIVDQDDPTNAQTEVFVPDTVSFYTGLMEHLQYQGDLEKRDPGAVLSPNGEGELSVNVSGIPEGHYAVYVHLRTEGSVDLNVRVPNNSQWEKVSSANNSDNDFRIGNVRVADGVETVRIDLKNNLASDMAFDRVTLAKTDE